jgi:hypothetical protein
VLGNVREYYRDCQVRLAVDKMTTRPGYLVQMLSLTTVPARRWFTSSPRPYFRGRAILDSQATAKTSSSMVHCADDI